MYNNTDNNYANHLGGFIMKMVNKATKTLLVAGLSLLSISSVFASTTNIDSLKSNPAFKVESSVNKSSNGPIDTVIMPADGVSKEEFQKELDAFYAKSPTEKKLYNLNDTVSKAYKDSELVSKFDTDIEYDWFDPRAVGVAQVIWKGSSPLNCDDIEMSNSFRVSGVGVGFGFGSDGRWDVKPGFTSATATWSRSYTNKYSVVHDYTNVDFSGVDLFLRQTTTGYFTFGTKTYEVNATDSSIL